MGYCCSFDSVIDRSLVKENVRNFYTLQDSRAVVLDLYLGCACILLNSLDRLGRHIYHGVELPGIVTGSAHVYDLVEALKWKAEQVYISLFFVLRRVFLQRSARMLYGCKVQSAATTFLYFAVRLKFDFFNELRQNFDSLVDIVFRLWPRQVDRR